MKNSARLNKIIVFIVLPAISWLFFNSVYYRHLHELPSGITISHAHPYDKTSDNNSTCPFSSHDHTEDEYLLYDVMSNLIVPIVFVLFAIATFFTAIIQDYRFELKESIYQSEFYLYKNYRGPPAKF